MFFLKITDSEKSGAVFKKFGGTLEQPETVIKKSVRSLEKTVTKSQRINSDSDSNNGDLEPEKTLVKQVSNSQLNNSDSDVEPKGYKKSVENSQRNTPNEEGDEVYDSSEDFDKKCQQTFQIIDDHHKRFPIKFDEILAQRKKEKSDRTLGKSRTTLEKSKRTSEKSGKTLVKKPTIKNVQPIPVLPALKINSLIRIIIVL